MNADAIAKILQMKKLLLKVIETHKKEALIALAGVAAIYGVTVAYPFSKGMLEYHHLNNDSPLNPYESTKESLTDELREMLEELRRGHLINAFMEFGDVLNSFCKHFLPKYLVTDPIFWFGAAYVNPMVAIKLGRRYARNGCIRNHKNHSHAHHNCKRHLDKLQIYFGASVAAGGADNAKKFVEYLSRFGNVLTANLALKNPDEPNKTPEQIHYHDMQRLIQADVVVCDVSKPTTGTGYMIGHAVNLGIPVLCLFANDSPVSAMLAGSKSLTVRQYSTYHVATKHIRAFIAKNRSLYPTVKFNHTSVLVIGPPGAGKTTLGQDLSSRFHMQSISTGQILRDNPTPRITELMDKGELIPAAEMMEILNKRLKEGDAGLFGYVVDGYPSSLENLHAWKAVNPDPDVVVYMDASQEACANRIVGRNARPSDTAAIAKSRRATYDLDPELVKNSFPNSAYFYIDTSSSTKPELAADKVTAFLDSRTGNTSRFHVHIDGPNVAHLVAFINRIEYENPELSNRFSLEKVSDLCLGPQVNEMPESYNDMPNFHTIVNANYEGFLTFNMGEKFDVKALKTILTHVRNSKLDYNIELEEYINKAQVDTTGRNNVRREYIITPNMKQQLKKLSAFEKNRAKNIPELELHLGFDLPRTDKKLNLESFVKKVSDKGLSNGGWFQFDDANEKLWQYRSNQLQHSTPIEQVLETLAEQAKATQDVVSSIVGRKVVVNTSLEIIHGIWKYDGKK